MPASAGTGNTAPSLTTATALFLTWSLLSFIVRVWTKASRSDGWGAEDTVLSLAGVSIVVNATCTFYAVSHGYGNLWPDLAAADNQRIHQAIYAAQTFYIISLGLVKASASLFIARFLTRGQESKLLCSGVLVLCGVWATASILAVAIRSPLQTPWETVDGSETMFVRWVAVEATGFALDLITVVLPVCLIWGLQMKIRRRLALSSIFALRLAVSPVVGLRLYNLAPSQNLEHDKPSIQAQVFTQIAMDGAFLLASITCLKPFLRPFYSDYSAQVGADAQAYTVYDRKINRSRGEAYHELNHSRSKDGSNGKRSVIRSRHTDDGQPPLSLRPDKCEYEATAHADPRSKATGDENMLISKTQAWSVSYD